MKNLFSQIKLKNLILPLIGFAALIWFLIRVLPKPSRATYPCMKATAPIASSFIIYILGLFLSALLFKRAKFFLKQSRYKVFMATVLAGILVTFFTLPVKKAKASNIYMESAPDGPNNPMGEGIGVMPGRVVWMYNPNATDENCTEYTDADGDGDYWWMGPNTNLAIVYSMFNNGIKMLTNTVDEKAAWDSIFCYYNRTHGRGNIGYKAGEKIAMKINLNAPQGYSEVNTSSQAIYSVIKSLVDKVGVKTTDITFGDPWQMVDSSVYGKIINDYKGVHALGYNTQNSISQEVLYSSDGLNSNHIPACFTQATYIINIPVFKKHHRAGISLCSKNHFGTMNGGGDGGAPSWHYSLPASQGGGDVDNGSYGLYRCFVDFIGYKNLGGKTVLYLIDGLWGSTNWAHPAIKWRMPPFNNDYPSSLFLSQDPVAIESVGFDFLFYEFDENHPTEGAHDDSDNRGPFPHYPGTDDFLHQAADTNNWPKGIKYAPNGDGIHLKSMGTHEHWNNAEDKQYSRNLGLNKGIELVSNYANAINNSKFGYNADFKNYPNPFSTYTVFKYNLQNRSTVGLFIYDLKGSLIRELVNLEQASGLHSIQWDGLDNRGLDSHSGLFIAKLTIRAGEQFYYQTVKVLKK